ncbi:MAG: GreA/GreB family elongation factor [Verrucomicrobiota bacterium]
MNKTILVKTILARLEAELELYSISARAAHAEATHEQNKAENKYDTRALEASYLAHGQSRQAAETEHARQYFEALIVRAFTPRDPIDLGALVELENKGEHSFYFIGPKAGGTEVLCEGKEVLVITPQSPLGRELLGKMEGNSVMIGVAGARNQFRIVSVR